LAEVGIPGERLVALETDHFGLLSCPKNEEMLRAIKDIIKNALSWASFRRLSASSSLHPSSSENDSSDSINDVLSDGSWQITDPAEGEFFSEKRTKEGFC